MWELAAILFACVAVNHLGLITAIERVARIPLPVINCSKCLTFWVAMAWCFVHGFGFVNMAAISLGLAYAALWLELIMGIIDSLYYRIYEKIITTDATDEASADGNDADKDSAVS